MEFTEEWKYFNADCANCQASQDGRCSGEWGWCVDWECWEPCRELLEEDDDY